MQFDIRSEKKWVTPNPYFRLYITHLGMNITDSWKVFKRHHREGGSIPSLTEFEDITVYDMIKEVERLNAAEENETDRVRAVDTAPSEERTTLFLSSPISSHGKHTMVLLEGKKQVRYILCSSVNLVHIKVTMIFKDFTK